MNDIGYKTAYLHLFNRITDLIAVLERDGGYGKRTRLPGPFRFVKQYNICFAALMAATKFHFDGPETLSLDSARSQRPLDPDLPTFVPARQSPAKRALRPRGKWTGCGKSYTLSRNSRTFPSSRLSDGDSESAFSASASASLARPVL